MPRTGLEPARLSTLAPETSASTIPPPGQITHICIVIRAENEARTRDPDLGKVVLYQLSYFRIDVYILNQFITHPLLNAVAKVQLFFKVTSNELKKTWYILFLNLSAHSVTIIRITEMTIILYRSVCMQHCYGRMIDAIEHIGLDRRIMYHILKDNFISHFQLVIKTP